MKQIVNSVFVGHTVPKFLSGCSSVLIFRSVEDLLRQQPALDPVSCGILHSSVCEEQLFEIRQLYPWLAWLLLYEAPVCPQIPDNDFLVPCSTATPEEVMQSQLERLAWCSERRFAAIAQLEHMCQRMASLSERELDVVAGIRLGLTVKEIAMMTQITGSTVGKHLRKARQKLVIDSSAEVVSSIDQLLKLRNLPAYRSAARVANQAVCRIVAFQETCPYVFSAAVT